MTHEELKTAMQAAIDANDVTAALALLTAQNTAVETDYNAQRATTLAMYEAMRTGNPGKYGSTTDAQFDTLLKTPLTAEEIAAMQNPE